MIVVVLLCTAIAEPQWFTLEHGGCKEKGHDSGSDSAIHYLGLNRFFYMGHFIQSSEKPHLLQYKFGPNHNDSKFDL